MLFEQFDLPIIKFLTGFVGVSRLFDHLVYLLASRDVFNGIAMMSLLWFAWFYHVPKETIEKKNERQARLVIVLVGSVLAVVLARALQHTFHIHQRPVLANLGIKFPPFVDTSLVNTWNSFPSDHAMLFYALATGLWRINRSVGIAAFLWTTFIICLPRIYIGSHYPSDIISGALFGIGFMLAFERLPLRNLAGHVQSWSKLYPGLFYGGAFIITDQIADLFDDVRTICIAILSYLSGGG